MEITQAIEAARKTQGPKCRVGQLLTELSSDDAQEFADVIADARYQHSQIAEGMTRLGHTLRQDAVMKHRMLRCSCGPR